jgi:zinc transport system substrate-binding protein
MNVHHYYSKMWVLLSLCVVFPLLSIAQVQVMVSIPPQIYFVEQVGGDLVQVESLLPPGGFPHTYEPTPKQMRQLTKSDMYVRIHVEFEDAWWEKIITANSNMYVVDTLAEIELLDASEADAAHAHDDHEHEHGDPHVWLSPQLVQQQAATICEGLMQIDPDNAETYLARKSAFVQQLDELDQEIRAKLADLSSRTFLVFHPSWSYFAHAYQLEQLSIEIEGKEPSAAEMAQMIKTVKAHNIRVIFVQPQTSRRSAETIARQIGANVEILDPLAQNWLENMQIVAETLANALK